MSGDRRLLFTYLTSKQAYFETFLIKELTLIFTLGLIPVKHQAQFLKQRNIYVPKENC